MGLFDSTEQQDKAREMARRSFLDKARRALAKKLIEEGAVDPIRPPTPGDPADAKRARDEEAALLQIADDLINGKEVTYKGRRLDLLPQVQEARPYLDGIRVAADEFGNEAAAAVKEKTGFSSGGFWLGLIRWIFSGFGLFGGPSFMECQAQACAPRIAKDFRTRVSRNPVLTPYLDEIGPDALQLVENEMRDGVLRSANVPGMPPARPPEPLIGVQRRVTVEDTGPASNTGDDLKDLRNNATMMVDKVVDVMKKKDPSLDINAPATKFLRGLVIDSTERAARRRPPSSTSQAFATDVFNGALAELDACVDDIEKLKAKYHELREKHPELALDPNPDFPALQVELKKARDMVKENDTAVIGFIMDSLNAKPPGGTETLFDVLKGQGQKVGPMPEGTDTRPPPPSADLPEGLTSGGRTFYKKVLKPLQAQFASDDMKLAFLRHSGGTGTADAAIIATAVEGANILARHDQEWANAIRGASTPQAKQEQYERMLHQVDEELKGVIKDDDLRRAMALELVDGYLVDAKKQNRGAPPLGDVTCPAEFKNASFNFAYKVLREKVDSIFPAGDERLTILAGRAKLKPDEFKNKIATAAATVVTNKAMQGATSYQDAYDKAYKALQRELASLDETLRNAIAEAMAYELAKAEAAKHRLATGGYEPGWEPPATPPTEQGQTLLTSVITDTLQAKLQSQFASDDMKLAFLRYSSGDATVVATPGTLNMADGAIKATAVQGANILARHDQEWADAIRAASTQQDKQLLYNLMLHQVDEELGTVIKDDDLRRAMALELVDGYLDDAKKQNNGVPHLGDVTCPPEFKNASFNFACKLLREKVDSIFPNGDARLATLASRAKLDPGEFKKKIVAAAATVVTNKAMQGATSYQDAYDKAYKALQTQLATSFPDETLRNAIAEAMAYELAKAEAAKHRLATGGYEPGWEPPAAPPTEQGQKLLTSVITDTIQAKFGSPAMQKIFLREANGGSLPADAAAIPELANAKMQEAGKKIKDVFAANEQEWSSRLAAIQNLKDGETITVITKERSVGYALNGQSYPIVQQVEKTLSKTAALEQLKAEIMQTLDDGLKGTIRNDDLRRAIAKTIADQMVDAKVGHTVAVTEPYAMAERRFMDLALQDLIKFDRNDPQMAKLMKAMEGWNNGAPINFELLATDIQRTVADALTDPEMLKKSPEEFQKELDRRLQALMCDDQNVRNGRGNRYGFQNAAVIAHFCPVIAASVTGQTKGGDTKLADHDYVFRAQLVVNNFSFNPSDPDMKKKIDSLKQGARFWNQNGSAAGGDLKWGALEEGMRNKIDAVLRNPATRGMSPEQFQDHLRTTLYLEMMNNREKYGFIGTAEDCHLLCHHLAQLMAAPVTEAVKGRGVAPLAQFEEDFKKDLLNRVEGRVQTMLDPARNKDMRILLNSLRIMPSMKDHGDGFVVKALQETTQQAIMEVMKGYADGRYKNESEFREALKVAIKNKLREHYREHPQHSMSEEQLDEYANRISQSVTGTVFGKPGQPAEKELREKVGIMVLQGLSGPSAPKELTEYFKLGPLANVLTNELVRILAEDDLAGMTSSQIDDHIRSRLDQVLREKRPDICKPHNFFEETKQNEAIYKLLQGFSIGKLQSLRAPANIPGLTSDTSLAQLGNLSPTPFGGCIPPLARGFVVS